MFVLSLDKPKGSPSYHPREDSYLYDAGKNIFIVADGVTRDKYPDGNYPDPSPARLAADAFCSEVIRFLGSTENITETSIRTAFEQANRAIKAINEKLGFNQDCDYKVKDLAGTVAAIAINVKGFIHWGHIGDCGVATLNSEADVTWQTDDDIAKARPYFPDANELNRKVRIRRDFRNNPNAQHVTYGVLTGEESALTYVKTGRLRLEADGTLMVFSDGARFLLREPALRQTLLSTEEGLQDAILERRHNEPELQDEITVIVAKVTEMDLS